MKTNETRMRELRAWLAQTESTPLEEMDAFFTRRLSGYEAHMLAHWAADYENLAAAGMLVRYAFRESGLHRIEANVMPRVLEKNGFVNEGLSRDCLKINGVWEDRIHMMKISRAMRGR